MTCRPPIIRARSAFTIVELLIAIGIVALLAAIVVSASLGLVAKSEERQTQNVLRLLDLALAEWETSADRKLSIGPGTGVTDLSYDTRHVFTVTEILGVVRRSRTANEILARIDPNLLIPIEPDSPPPAWVVAPPDPDPDFAQAATQYTDFAGGIAVLDAWGTAIRAVHPGALAPPGFTGEIDDDGTEETPLELIYGEALSRRVLFVSAGPDGSFGSLEAPPGDPLHEPAEDNVYSYPGGHVHDE